MLSSGTSLPSIWRDRAFVLYWSGRSVSLTGSMVTAVALPLLAAGPLGAGPLGLSILEACVWLPFLGLPLIAGVQIDRCRRRPVLLTCDAARLAMLGLVCWLGWTGQLTLPALAVLAFVSQSATVFSQIGEQAYLPALVRPEHLMTANSAVMAANSTATLCGPGIAGLLAQVFGPLLAVAVDALSYFVSFVTTLAIRRPESRPRRPASTHLGAEITEGLRFVWRTSQLRLFIVWGLLFNGFWQVMTTPFLLYALNDVRLGPAWWGVVLSGGGVGALLGSVLAPALGRRLGPVRAVVIVGGAGHVVLLTIPLGTEPSVLTIAVWTFAVGLSGLSSGVANVLILSMRAQLTPAHLRGRVTATARLVMYGGLPLGAVAGGVLAHSLGNRAALWLGLFGVSASAFSLLPLLRHPPAR